MNDTKTGGPQVDHNRDHRLPADSHLHQGVSALLDAKGGIDEARAKRLRKQWDALQGEGRADPSLVALFARLRERVHTQVALRERQFTEMEGNLAQLRTCLADGDVRQAQALEQSVVAGLNRITGLSGSRRQRIITGLEALRPKLQELTAWRRWGTTQAREKIIAEIKAIHKSGATLPQIAGRIREAREEWRQWDAAGEGGDPKRYGIFDRACSEAYRPCQVHFDHQKQQRREHTRVRVQICELLEREFAAVEWRDPPWKKLQQLVQAQSREWRAVGAAEFKQRKPLQRRFAAIAEKFNERLGRERRRCYQTRAHLIDEIEQLAEREDSNAALAELRTLKKQWAPTVPCARAKERALWERFTGACDKVHGKREQARKEASRMRAENRKARAALCAEIEAVGRGGSKNPPANPATLGADLKGWEAQWARLGEAPKAADAADKKLAARYRNAVAGARNALARAAAEGERRMRELLGEKSEICAALEALALAGTAADADPDPDIREAKHRELTARWQACGVLSDELEQAIGARYRLAAEAVLGADALRQLQDALPANLARLHELLLQLEIRLELESPVEFSRRRMALQVGRLSTALQGGRLLAPPQGGRLPAPPQDGRLPAPLAEAEAEAEAGAEAGATQSTEGLMRRILLVGAVDEARRRAAFKRFARCLGKHGGASKTG